MSTVLAHRDTPRNLSELQSTKRVVKKPLALIGSLANTIKVFLRGKRWAWVEMYERKLFSHKDYQFKY